MMRTYALPHAANAGKVERVAAVLGEYQATAGRVQAWQYERLLSGEGLWNRGNPKHIGTRLSQRYLRSVVNQVVAGMLSWQALTQEYFRNIVRSADLSPALKRDLFRINARKAWYAKQLDLSEIVVGENGRERRTGQNASVPDETLWLARRIVKHVKQRRNRLPRLARSRTMMLDGPVAQFEASRSDRFDYWVRVSTLEKGKPAWLPLNSHDFAGTAPGQWAALTQVTVAPDRSITVKQVKKTPDADPQVVASDGSESIGVDFGLTTLFASSAGNLLGRSLYPWLQRIDEQLVTLASNLQRQGIKPATSKRYRRFQNRIREHIRNEVGRCLNRLVALHDPAQIVVESLDFRYGGLSKRLNRLLSRAGRKAVQAKLAALGETRGITITEVPAAHTSRECAGCGYVDTRNRDKTRFSCRFCGRTGNADVNASLTVKARRSWPEPMTRVSRSQLLNGLDKTFHARWGIPAQRVRQARRTRRARPPTPTTDGLAHSPTTPVVTVAN